MKCDYCGAEVSAGKNYCLQCGARMDRSREEQPPVQEQVLESAAFVNDLPEPERNAPVAVAAPVVQQIPAAKPVRPVVRAPRLQLPVKRGLCKMIFLGLVTLGIYPVVIWSRIVTELNLAASRHDGKRTMPYFAMLMLAPITLGVFAFVWMHRFCRRVGDELQRRRISYKFGPSTFWLWNVLGSLIIVGPFIFTHKLMKSMNQINGDFNLRG